MVTRRQLLKTGVVAGVGLALTRLLYGPFRADPALAPDTEYRYQVLDDNQRSIIAALAPVLLAGALPTDTSAQNNAIAQIVRGVDVAVSGLPTSVQSEIQQLFSLLGLSVTRRWLAGVKSPWLTASPQEIEEFLQRWRFSYFALLRSGYQALHQLVLAAWYANPQSWERIGYPGPPNVQ